MKKLSKYSALIVDDDPDSLIEMKNYLSCFFGNVYATTRPKIAIDEFDIRKPDVVFVDIMMPEVNGFSLVKTLQKSSHNALFVIISAYDDKENLFKAINLNVFDYLKKPLMPDDMQNILKKISRTLKHNERYISLPENYLWDNKYKILSNNNKPIELSQSKTKLLDYFVNNLNRVIDGYELFDKIWKDREYSQKSIRSIVSKLRKKLPSFMVIKNIYGGKYSMSIKPESNETKEIVAQQEKFASLIPIPTVAVDLDHNILFKNKAFDKHFSLPNTEEDKCFYCLHGLSKPCAEKGYDCPKEAVLKYGKSKKVLHSFIRDGKIFHTDVVAEPLRDKNGEMFGVIFILYDVTPHFKEKEKLKTMANYDSLTGLTNRVVLEEEIEKAIDRSNKLGNNFALLFIDIDDFKEINDTYGHSVGDIFLKKFTQRLKNSLRKNDLVARYGGDEFVVVIDPLSNKDNLEKITQHILNTTNVAYHIDNYKIESSCSVGVSLYMPNCGKTREDLLKEADSSMYIIKRNGKSSYKIF